MSTTMPGMCALPYLAWVHYHASAAQDYNAASLRSQKAGAEFGQRTQSDFPTLIVHSIISDEKQRNATHFYAKCFNGNWMLDLICI